MLKKICTAAALSVLLAACAKVPLTDRKQLNIIPAGTMQSMSFQNYSEFLKTNQLSADQEKTAMIKRVGANIERAVAQYLTDKGLASKLKGFQWEFNLVEDATMNAWCMPGGKVVFYTGILPICQDETGVAIVMGHEVAHAIANHGGERMSQTMVAQGVNMAATLATSQQSAQTKQIFQQAMGMGTQMGMLKFSRSHESEADHMGLMFMAMAGYDPQQAPKFWERMSAMSGSSSTPEFMSTHPSHEQRIADLNKWLPEAQGYYKK